MEHVKVHRSLSQITEMRYTFAMSQFKIHVSKDYLIFCAAHFITYDGECEPLHGHNYRASVTVEGSTQEDQFVFNFVTLKRLMRDLVNQLDHRTLLPDSNPHFKIAVDSGTVTLDSGDRHYVLPESDVRILPLSNTTAEMLAKYFADQLKRQLGNTVNLTACEVEVEEVIGQSATYREEWR
jgi:6-pyruvoyltetrahydropterin/6-carboxytetrahydropterin synthase